MRMFFRSRVVGATFVALALVLGACSSGDDGGPIEGTTIEIASFAFGESEIVAEIYKQALEAKGYTVNHQVQVGPRGAEAGVGEWRGALHSGVCR